MTTDNFTVAARAEAERRNPSNAPNGLTRASNAISRRDFRDGAEWARAHLAQQEPTGALIRKAQADAWDEGQDAGWEEAQDQWATEGMVGDRWKRADTPNPYRTEQTNG